VPAPTFSSEGGPPEPRSFCPAPAVTPSSGSWDAFQEIRPPTPAELQAKNASGLGQCPHCARPWCWRSLKGWVCRLKKLNLQSDPPAKQPKAPRPKAAAESGTLWQPQPSDVCEQCGNSACWLTPKGRWCLLLPADKEQVGGRRPQQPRPSAP